MVRYRKLNKLHSRKKKKWYLAHVGKLQLFRMLCWKWLQVMILSGNRVLLGLCQTGCQHKASGLDQPHGSSLSDMHQNWALSIIKPLSALSWWAVKEPTWAVHHIEISLAIAHFKMAVVIYYSGPVASLGEGTGSYVLLGNLPCFANNYSPLPS